MIQCYIVNYYIFFKRASHSHVLPLSSIPIIMRLTDTYGILDNEAVGPPNDQFHQLPTNLPHPSHSRRLEHSRKENLWFILYSRETTIAPSSLGALGLPLSRFICDCRLSVEPDRSLRTSWVARIFPPI